VRLALSLNKLIISIELIKITTLFADFGDVSAAAVALFGTISVCH